MTGLRAREDRDYDDEDDYDPFYSTRSAFIGIGLSDDYIYDSEVIKLLDSIKDFIIKTFFWIDANVIASVLVKCT